MTLAIIGIENDTPVYNPDAATLVRWAVLAHAAECRECGSETSDSRCPNGERLAAAAELDRTWVPSPRTGA